jgi:predicted nucleic acid-binding protein
MTDLVIDASIVIKWVVEEAGTPQALGLQKYRLFAPDLLIAECANVFWKKARRREMSLEEAGLAAELLERADIEFVPTRRFWSQATRWAIELDHPAYDCIYLALADSLSCDFITADAELQRMSKKLRLGPKVHLLETASL